MKHRRRNSPALILSKEHASTWIISRRIHLLNFLETLVALVRLNDTTFPRKIFFSGFSQLSRPRLYSPRLGRPIIKMYLFLVFCLVGRPVPSGSASVTGGSESQQQLKNMLAHSVLEVVHFADMHAYPKDEELVEEMFQDSDSLDFLGLTAENVSATPVRLLFRSTTYFDRF